MQKIKSLLKIFISNKFLDQNALFDVIIMSDVIEHLDDPFITLNLIEKNLNPNGILIFTTFNMDALVPRIMGRKYHWIMPMHKFYFSNNHSFVSTEKMNEPILLL